MFALIQPQPDGAGMTGQTFVVCYHRGWRTKPSNGAIVKRDDAAYLEEILHHQG
jgi:hypothetical protein